MLPDENRTIEEDEMPKKVEEPEEEAPLTKEMFSAQLQRLAERAKAAGLIPIRTMAKTYVKRGMALIESLLASLEYEDSPKKKE